MGKEVLMELRDDGMCFVCGKNNPVGLKINFKLTGHVLTAQFIPEKKHQGYADIVHGGIIAIILDEMLVNLPWLLGKQAVTGELVVRYKQPVAVGERLNFNSYIVREKAKLLLVTASARKDDGSLVAVAEGKCIRIERTE